MIERAWLRSIVWLNGKGKSAAVRLTKVTGKSDVRIHPKHLVTIHVDRPWYLAHVEPGMRVLDIGCGNGVHGLRATRKGAKVVGLEYDDDNLHTARRLAKAVDQTRLCFLKGNAEHHLPFAAGQFDLVLLLDVIEHLELRIELLKEIGRVLDPKGLLLLAAPNNDTTWKRRLREAGLPSHTDPDHKIEYSWSELASELRQGGFAPVTEPMPIVYDTQWAGLFDMLGGISLGLYRRLASWKVQMAKRFPQETSGWRVVARQERA